MDITALSRTSLLTLTSFSMSASQKSERPIRVQIVAATNNQHKLSEIRPLIEPDFRLLSLEDIGCHDELPETKETLQGNSLQKAAYVYERYQLPCFADDTGLEIEALQGAPGVYSARYAGDQKNSDDNINLLLKNLSGSKNRRGQFRTIITLLGIGGTRIFEGVLRGVILEERRGSSGFGYDPVFLPDGFTKTLAELSMEEKNRISHRGLAIAKLVDFLKQHSGRK
jgi:XTP/dITP diphosphohydrolase